MTSILEIQLRLFRRDVSMKVKARSPISWLQHDSVGECEECADPMLLAPLTWPPLSQSNNNSPVVLKAVLTCKSWEQELSVQSQLFIQWNRKLVVGTSGLTIHFHARPLATSTRDHNRVTPSPSPSPKHHSQVRHCPKLLIISTTSCSLTSFQSSY